MIDDLQMDSSRE